MTTQAFTLPVSDVLRQRDVLDLKWYFSCGGADKFRASTMGAMLDRASLYASTTEPCGRCQGVGFVARNPVDRHLTEHQAMLLGLLDFAEVRTLPPLADMPCAYCGSSGLRVRKTSSRKAGAEPSARPTGSSIRGGSSDGMPADADLARMGLVARKLSLLPKGAVEVLEAYYSPGGGTMESLWALTPAGKTMLKSNGLELPHYQFFANKRAEQQREFCPTREAVFRAADEQASERHAAACQAWNMAGAAR